MKIFGRNPTLWIAVISTGVVVLGTIGLEWLTVEQAGLFVAVINAIAGAVNAWTVRPISPVAFTYAVGAIASLVATYGLSVSVESLAAINLFVIAVLGLLSYGNVSPQDTPISKA
jgi:hypothetical protein